MAYRRDDIERVRAATDLVELVAEVTKVKRSGRTTMAICPFHQEKTPSLSVDGARGLFHCFGCGKSGDVFGWIKETQGLDFTESLELLARRSGITLQVDPGAAKRRGEREGLIAAVDKAIEFYEERLRTAPDAANARSYVRQRGYDGDTVAAFHIGYSPADWSVLADHLKGLGVKEKTLVGAGLAVRSSRGRLVDRFRGRLMFPIYDLRGDPVGFGARQLDGEPPKYLNSPETAIYQKSRLLYGLNWAKSEIVRTGESVVVEGYTDVIGMHEADMPVAVATCGTGLGDDHLRLLLRFAPRAVLAFDADAAGAGASLRSFDHATATDLDLRVAVLPEGRDPADLASSGDVETLRKAVADSAPLMQFRLEQELTRFDLGEPDARARAIRATAAIVAGHPDRFIRHEYSVLLARRTGIEMDVVTAAVAEAARHGSGRERVVAAVPPRLTGEQKAERELLRLLLANDASLRGVEVAVEDFTVDQHRAAYELVAPAVMALEPGEPPDLGSLLGEDESELGEWLRRLALDERPLGDVAELIGKVQVGVLDRRIGDLRRQLERIDPAVEPEEYSDRFQELIGLEKSRHQGGPS